MQYTSLEVIGGLGWLRSRVNRVGECVCVGGVWGVAGSQVEEYTNTLPNRKPQDMW